MAKVAFEVVEQGAVVTISRPDGRDLVLESGKPYETDSPAEINDLDSSSWLKRVKEKS